MKNFKILAFLMIAVLASCAKEEVKPTNSSSNGGNTVTTSQRDIEVKYHVYAVSGDIKITALVPVNGVLSNQTILVNRLNHEISFDFKSGNKFVLEAINANPSNDEIIVEIYVDGTLVKSNSVNAAGATAKAEIFVNN